MLHYFPTKQYILEGHFGIPFQHRLPSHRSIKKLYLKIFHVLGFGYNTKKLSFQEWSNLAIDFLDKYCFYRSKKNIFTNFGNYWSIKDISYQMINYKLAKRNRSLLKIALLLPTRFINYMVKYYGSILIQCEKKDVS